MKRIGDKERQKGKLWKSESKKNYGDETEQQQIGEKNRKQNYENDLTSENGHEIGHKQKNQKIIKIERKKEKIETIYSRLTFI